MGRFLIDIPTGRAPESRTIFGQKPTDLRQAYMAALAARQGIGLLGDITPSAKTVGDIKRAFLKATSAPTQQAPQPAAPTDAIVQPGTPIPEPAEVAAFRQAQQQHRQQQALMRSEGLQQAVVAGMPGQVVSAPQMIADAVGAVNAAQTPEQLAVAKAAYERALSQVQPSQPMQPAVPPTSAAGPRQLAAPSSLFGMQDLEQKQSFAPRQPAAPQQPAASRQLVKETVAAPTDAASALLLAKAAAASGNAQEFRNALLAARTVDVSDMPEQDAGDLFSDAGKRQRLVKMMLGLRTQRSTAQTPYQTALLNMRQKELGVRKDFLDLQKTAEKRKRKALDLRAAKQKLMMPIEASLQRARTDFTTAQTELAAQKIVNDIVPLQAREALARLSLNYQRIRESRYRMSEKAYNRKLAVARAGRTRGETLLLQRLIAKAQAEIAKQTTRIEETNPMTKQQARAARINLDKLRAENAKRLQDQRSAKAVKAGQEVLLQQLKDILGTSDNDDGWK